MQWIEAADLIIKGISGAIAAGTVTYDFERLMDGATLRDEILYVLTPMAVPGIASTILLNIILAWNEAFWTLNLTTVNAAPLTAFIASYSSPEGLFYAKLSAASTMAIAPILVLGWFSQKQLVRGLTFGAVK